MNKTEYLGLVKQCAIEAITEYQKPVRYYWFDTPSACARGIACIKDPFKSMSFDEKLNVLTYVTLDYRVSRSLSSSNMLEDIRGEPDAHEYVIDFIVDEGFINSVVDCMETMLADTK